MSSPVATAAKRLRYGRFAKLQHATKGMLSPAVYKMIHDRASAAPDLDTIEVGGANGSASIAFAWAKIETGKASSHIVVEKFEGGSLRRYGGFEDNLDRFNRNVAQFGAEGRIKLFPQHLTRENGPEVLSLVGTGQIAGFMSDADGRIDRDFALFLPFIHPDGFIVIDDYHPTSSWKHALTYRLLNRFVEWKLFIVDATRKGTVFGRPAPEADIDRLNPAECAEIVESVRVDFGFERNSEEAKLYFR
jgi:hypothetical protein